jgi:hypothetical protein
MLPQTLAPSPRSATALSRTTRRVHSARRIVAAPEVARKGASEARTRGATPARAHCSALVRRFADKTGAERFRTRCLHPAPELTCAGGAVHYLGRLWLCACVRPARAQRLPRHVVAHARLGLRNTAQDAESVRVQPRRLSAETPFPERTAAAVPAATTHSVRRRRRRRPRSHVPAGRDALVRACQAGPRARALEDARAREACVT